MIRCTGFCDSAAPVTHGFAHPHAAAAEDMRVCCAACAAEMRQMRWFVWKLPAA